MKNIIVFFIINCLLCVPQPFAQEWEELRGAHFNVYYKKAPLDFAKTVERSAERYYKEIADRLGFKMYRTWKWDEKPTIYIYDDEDDYYGSSKAPWSHGIANVYAKRIETFPTAHGFFDSTLPHELGHIMFREFVGLQADVPLWFEEGVAMYQESAKRWGSHKIVKQAIEDGTFIPVSDLQKKILKMQSDREFVQLFYAQSASLVYYIITEFGKTRFVRLCRELKDGKSFEQALKKAYVRFKSLDHLNRGWLNYLEIN